MFIGYLFVFSLALHRGHHILWIDSTIPAKGTIFKQYQEAYVVCGPVKQRYSFSVRGKKALVIAKQTPDNSTAIFYDRGLRLEQSWRAAPFARL